MGDVDPDAARDQLVRQLAALVGEAVRVDEDVVAGLAVAVEEHRTGRDGGLRAREQRRTAVVVVADVEEGDDADPVAVDELVEVGVGLEEVGLQREDEHAVATIERLPGLRGAAGDDPVGVLGDETLRQGDLFADGLPRRALEDRVAGQGDHQDPDPRTLDRFRIGHGTAAGLPVLRRQGPVEVAGEQETHALLHEEVGVELERRVGGRVRRWRRGAQRGSGGASEHGQRREESETHGSRRP